jgi:hypothetical protein
MGVDKCKSIGNYYSPAALVNRLRSVYQEQFHEYLLDSKEIKENERNKIKYTSRQTFHCTSQQQQSQRKSLETDLQNGLLLRTCP